MPEIDIKRVNFFDGQFLKQGEFLDLDQYHRHMRRRLLFTLFDGSGVIQLEPHHLTIEVENAAEKLIRVRAGTALGMRTDEVESREVVLRDDQVVDLKVQTPPIVAGDTAVVTIHYHEDTTDPSSEGGVTGDTRIDEQAVVSAHANALPSPTAPNGEPYVVLGEVEFDTMALDDTQRQQATIRAALLGAPPPSAGLTLSGFEGVDEPSADLDFKINGGGFTAPAVVEFSKSGGGFTTPVAVPSSGISSTQLRIPKSSIPTDAVEGPVHVQSSGDTVTSSFVVTPPPEIHTMSPNPVSPSALLTLTGLRFYPGTVVGLPGGKERGPGSVPPFPDAGFLEELNEDSLKVHVTSDAGDPPVKVTVTTNGGTVQSATDLTVQL